MNRLPTIRLLGLVVFALGPALTLSVLEPALLSYHFLRLGLPAEARPALYGTLTFAGLVAASITQPIVGRWCGNAHALQRRATFMALGAVSAIGGIATLLSTSTLAGLFGGAVLTQVGANAAIAAWQPVISERIAYAQRGLAAGLRNGVELLAAATGRLIAAEITAQAAMGHHVMLTLLLFLPALGFATTFPIARRLFQTTPVLAEGKAPSSRVQPQPLSALMRNKVFRWWFINRTTFWCGAIASSAFLFLVATDLLRLSEADAQRFVAQLILVAGSSTALTLLPTAWLADRVGRPPLLVIAGVLAALGAMSLVVNRANVVLATLCIAAATSLFLSASLALASDLAPKQNAAPFLGFANLATTLGSAMGRLGGGTLASLTNALTQTRETGYLLLYAIAAALFAISALSAWRLCSGNPTPQR